jgi:hypothetical protein
MTGRLDKTALKTAVAQPAAVLPLAMSVAGVALILGHVAVAGPGPEADEGLAARLWWLLMVAQLPLIGYFATTWLSRAAGAARLVLALQVLGVAGNFLALRLFNL